LNDLRRAFALANAFKEGDLCVGGTTDDAVRADARRFLSHTRVGEIRRTPFVDDGVSAALEETRDRSRDGDLDALTIGALKETLLSAAGASWAREHTDALCSEVIAAVAKVMTDDELARVARRLSNPLPGGIGAPGHLGSRIQPNSAGDDEQEILFSILDGLTHGCGDVVIGLNPAADEVDTIIRLEQLLEQVVRRLDVPTRFCVLSDIVKQHQAQSRTRVEVGFQSLAGTSAALKGMVGFDADGLLDLARGFEGLYFETGQGSAVTNGTAEGIDMVTLEARAYGVARHVQRRSGRGLIVNDVAGFIGPEVFRTAPQLERACLEDLMMARLHGLTMGLDVCATFHMGIPPSELRELTARIVRRAAPTYLMAVAGNADPMLGYLTTSFREHPRLRSENGAAVTDAMAGWLSRFGLPAAADRTEAVCRLYARYMKEGGASGSIAEFETEGQRTIAALRERGLDVAGDAAAAVARADRIYEHARRALYARLEKTVLRDACGAYREFRSRAIDRDDYIAHPPAGERLRDGDAASLREAFDPGRQIQIVVSDGLNADAINEQLRVLLPPVRRLLAQDGHQVTDSVVVIHNGRVRAGYHVGQLVDAEVVVHFIGERPGTGLNSVSAYLTYGRDTAGRSRWDPLLEHSNTTAVCGIHSHGKPPAVAAAEIARSLRRILDQRRSGVALR
jgi:ethanolamine ammonia-lyase large subunit